jgi:putative hydrolase of the HAD superfamily
MVGQLPKAILLDLDDTITALSASGIVCWERICQRFAPRVPGLTAGPLFDAIARSRFRYWKDPERHRVGRLNLAATRRMIVRDAFDEMGISAPGLADEIADAYSREREDALWLLPGAVETLGFLRNQGVRLGLITNGSSAGQRRKIERFGLGRFFDLIVIEGEFGVGKPDERVFLHALEALGVAPCEAWMVGDNLEWDVRGSQRLGIFAVWVDSRGEGLRRASPVQPDRVVRSLSELAGAERVDGG